VEPGSRDELPLPPLGIYPNKHDVVTLRLRNKKKEAWAPTARRYAQHTYYPKLIRQPVTWLRWPRDDVHSKVGIFVSPCLLSHPQIMIHVGRVYAWIVLQQRIGINCTKYSTCPIKSATYESRHTEVSRSVSGANDSSLRVCT
jgi:hypothetical protein